MAVMPLCHGIGRWPKAAALLRCQNVYRVLSSSINVKFALEGLIFDPRAAEGGAGEEESRRGEVTGERAKEVARAAGDKAAGAWVMGG